VRHPLQPARDACLEWLHLLLQSPRRHRAERCLQTQKGLSHLGRHRHHRRHRYECAFEHHHAPHCPTRARPQFQGTS
jgi:hypothetical protein